MYMQQFKFTIRHIHGKENAADALSRLPVGEAAKEFVRQTEEYAFTILTDAIPATLLPRQVERQSELDPTLQFIISLWSPNYWWLVPAPRNQL